MGKRVFLILFCSYLFAQQNSSKTDLFDHYLEQSKKFENSNLDSIYFWLRKAELLALELKDSLYLSDLYSEYSSYYDLKSDYLNMLIVAKKSLDYLGKRNDLPRFMRAYHSLALYYSDSKNYTQAIYYNKKYANSASLLKDSVELSNAYNNLAEAYRDLKDYKNAFLNYQLAIKYGESDPNPIAVLVPEFNIGLIYMEEYQDEKALAIFEKSYQKSKAINDQVGLVEARLAEAKIYFRQMKYKIAEKKLLEAFKIGKKNKFNRLLLESAEYLELVYNRLANESEAKRFHKELTLLNRDLKALKNAELEELYAKNIELFEKDQMSRTLAYENKKNSELIDEKDNIIMFITCFGILLLGAFVYVIRATRIIATLNYRLQNSNDAKSKFFSIVSHDLKSPFVSIIGFSEYLKNNYAELDDKERLDSIERVHDSATNVFKLLNNVLDWARIQMNSISFNPVEIELNELLMEESYVFTSVASLKKISLHYSKLNQLTNMVYADRNMLKVAIRNLISNAIKFTKANGKVHISLEKVEKELNIHVKDSGVGIDDEMREKLFEIDSNKSLKGTEGEEGTGLGLVLVKEFVEKNKGRISVHSELGKGSCFTLSFPILT